MQANLYMIPIGIVENSMVTTVELYLPDLNMVISSSGSTTIDSEEAEERYQETKLIQEIEIDDQQIAGLNDLKDLVIQKETKEQEILQELESVMSEAIEKFQNQPQIHVPSPFEMNQIDEDLDPGLNSGLIFKQGFFISIFEN